VEVSGSTYLTFVKKELLLKESKMPVLVLFLL